MKIRHYDTLIGGAFLITLTHPENGDVLGKVVWGMVGTDRAGRWRKGDFCCSTDIREVDEEAKQCVSMNSVYEYKGELTKITMHITDLPRLRAGYSPHEIEELRKSKTGLSKAVLDYLDSREDFT